MKKLRHAVMILGLAALVAAVATAQAKRPVPALSGNAIPKKVSGKTCTGKGLASPCVEWTLSLNGWPSTYRRLTDLETGEYVLRENSVVVGVNADLGADFPLLTVEFVPGSSGWNSTSKHYEPCPARAGQAVPWVVVDDAWFQHNDPESGIYYPDLGARITGTVTLPC